ncbi:hypothetical protein D3C80_1998580 [compost metagenome]
MVSSRRCAIQALNAALAKRCSLLCNSGAGVPVLLLTGASWLRSSLKSKSKPASLPYRLWLGVGVTGSSFTAGTSSVSYKPLRYRSRTSSLGMSS